MSWFVQSHHYFRRSRWQLVVFSFISLVYQTAGAQNRTNGGCAEEADVIFVVDSSLSVRETCPLDVAAGSTTDNWNLTLNFIGEVVSAMPVDGERVRVGVVTFSTSVNEEEVIPLDAHKTGRSLRNHVVQLNFLGGNTNMTGALRFVRRTLADQRVPGGSARKQIIVLLTDGMNNVDSDPVQEARLIKQLGIRLYTVGVSEYVDDAQLKEMATAPASYSYIYARDFSHLNLLIGQLLDRLVCSKPPSQLPCRDSRADIALLLDASGSILKAEDNAPQAEKEVNWNLMKSFVVTLIENLKISADTTRIALIRFSHEADVVFHLNRYFTAAEAIQAVHSMKHVGSSTNTSGALTVMRTEVFTARLGDRPDVNNVGIIITDGQSNNFTATVLEALAAKDEDNIRMFAIGLTDEIDARELKSIASPPLSEHYFNRTSIPLVQTVASQLLWSVCHDPCPSSSSSRQTPGHCRNSQSRNSSYCGAKDHVSWTAYPGRLLLGRNYAILSDISSPALCQEACLQDNLCRSIQYISSLQQCSISYFTKDDAPDSFRSDSEVDYYEVNCVATM